MKKIFTHLFALFLLSLVATSNVWAETITLVPSGGTFSGGNNSYCKTWTSTSGPVVTFSVAVNNMTVGAVDGGFGIASGTSGSSVWNFTVNGYKIISYSFKYKLQENSTANNITITVNGNANAVTSDEKTLEVNDVNAFAASFTLSGTNETIILTDVTIEAEPLLENGAVYRFVCSGTTTVSLGASALTDVAAVSTSETEKAQQWYVTVSGSNYTFRNLANGRYLQGNNDTSDAWALTEESNNFTVTPVNGNYAIRGASHSNGYGYMHKEAGNNIVSWESGAANSQWTPIEVSYTAAELQAVWDEVEALVVPSLTVDGYQEKLDAMFTDQSCTVLNSTYAGKTLDAIKSDANYTGLPAVLRAMVEKVYNEQVGKSATAWSESTVAPADRPNGNNNTNHNLWTVADTWDNDYAKKFRVQMYEPYSVEGEITSFLRFNAHCNMDNPTGIYANSNQAIYIMVEGTIKPGAELWVAHQVGHGATYYYNNVAYTQLKEGLNVVPYFADGSQLWINYLVHTYDSETRTFPNKLSDFAPLKIHIEGGYINGFFNAMGDYRATTDAENLWGEVDNDADWDYYKARAALSGDFALLGHRQTLLFDFGTYNSTKGDFGVANDAGSIEYALPYHLEHIEVPDTTNCYGGSGNTFGDYSDTYYPKMNLDAKTGKINIMLEAWDRIMYSEHATMGLLSQSDIAWMNKLYPGWAADNTTFDIYNYGSVTVNGVTKTYKEFCGGRDYSDYYNHHGAAVGAASGYMSGGWRVCNYHYNTMGSIIGKIAKEAGPTWGPAHEIGHQHQAVFNLNGQTEVTNNFFSNVAVWYMGMGTSRYNGGEGNLEHVLEAFNTDGNDLYTNNIWAITHLYYRLWLYYHLAGNNTQFWPRLFELCRQTPLVNGGQISGETSLLRFYQHACTAAGEDLTEFFRAHGYFELMTDRLVGDYSNGTYNVTEEQIETAITAVEANNYPKNYAILLINDGTSDTTFKHDGKTKRSLWDSNASAEYGSVTDFIEGNTSVTKVYDAVVSADGTVTMSGGEGGVGFLIFNEEGELVSFSNKASFEISDEAAYLLATGKASIVAVDAENETTAAKVDLSAIQREMLKALIEKIEAMPIDDGSYTHVGFYTKASAGDLLAALESAKTAYESGSGYGAAYEMLYTEKEKFVNSQNLSFVPFDPSLTYVITNYEYTGHTMYLKSSDNYVYSQANIDQEAATARWQFKGTEGVYKVYNTNGTGSYLPKVAKSGHLSVVSDEASAVSYVLRESTPVGTWTIMLESPDDEYPALHENSSNKVVGWGTASNPSKWYLTAVENPNRASLVSTDELQSLIAKTEALVDVVGMAIPCALQTTDATAPFYLYCNANVTSGGDASLPAHGYNILDGNDQTFLHTVYNGNSVDGLNHYLLLDLGEGNTLSTIQFYYKTRHNGNSGSHPQVIKVEGSNDKETFVEIATISSGLPNGFSKEYTSSTLTNGNKYRYFRFMVTDTYSTATDGNGHEYFYIAEFGIPSLYTKIDAEYQAYVTETDMQTIYNAIVTAKTALKSGTDLSTAKDNLQDAYDTFYALYKKPIDDKKEDLEDLADATDIVVNSVGTIETSKITQLALTTDNLYCNEVRADDCGPTADGADSSANGYVHNLTDGKTTTFLHTNHSGGTAVNPPHYLRVYLGDGSTVKRFKFNYKTRDNGNNCPTTIVIEGCNEENGTYKEITTLTAAEHGLPNPGFVQAGGVAEAFESEIITMSTAYKYVRFKVTGVEGGGATFFVMSEFGFSTVEDVITIGTAYDGIVSEDLLYSTYNTSGDSHLMAAETSNPTLAQLEAQITKLTAAKATLEAAMNQVNKSGLETSLAAINALYIKMADGEGNIASDYTPSALTPEQLTAIKTVIDNAQAVFDNSGATQLDVNNAKTAVDEKYTELLTIENANVNLSGTFDKSELGTLITNAAELLSTINGKTENNSDYYAAAGIAIDELQEAYDAAVDAKDRYYLTQEQYATVKEALNNSYTTINPIVAADVADRDELTTLIANVKTLMEKIADAAADDYMPAVPLQATDEEDNFYIKLSRVGDGTIGNLIDKNSDGTGNTGTYVGSDWGGTIADYTHYVQVDLGEGVTIDKLLFDYTTRSDGDYSTERPTLIKVLGSNDNSNYAEITIIDEGLADEAGEQWSMQNVLELGARYRYIRFAVKSGLNSFHMSDFNLYAEMSHTLKEYYTTAQGLDFEALCMALQSAEDAALHYMTNEHLNKVVDALNGYRQATQAVVDADAADRTELEALILATEELVGEVATDVNVEEECLPLQCDNENAPYYIFCNAPEKSTTYPGDNLGVAALLDVDEFGEPVTSTYLHTAYSGDDAYDDLDHYLRVDMGEANLLSFKFAYISRSNTNNAPTEILIEGINDLEGGEWEEITTLTNLPATAYSSGEITNGKTYRYIRFMVKATVNNDEHNGHPFFAMSHFEMTVCKRVVLKEGTGIDAVCEAVVAAVVEKQQADYLLGHYATEDDCNNTLAELQAAYNALAEKIKEPLKTLIYNTTLLKNSLYDVESYTPADVALQCERDGEEGYLYCNAPETNSQWPNDNKGVAGCIDLTDGNPNLDTYLHTEYGNDQSADGLDHYLRVDLGEVGATYVEFGYVGRSGHESKSPKTVVVAATNDLNGEWTTIETLNMAQSNATTETKTGAVGNGVAYRYWRFMVTDTHFNGQSNGHKYFALSDFNVYRCADVVLSSQLKEEYAPKIHIYTTTELVADVEAAITAATAVYNNTNATMEDCNNAIAALQPVYDELARAIELYWCPVALTTDVAHPALYTIDAIGRGEGKAWQYNAQNNNITVVNKDAANLYHLWYFVQGAEEHTVKIVPVMTPGYELTANSADDFSDGANKVSAAAENGLSWLFYKNSEYNFKPYGKNTYLSHYGGGSNALGFYGSADGGSSVRFTAVEVEDYAKARLVKLAQGKSSVSAGTALGTYSENSANEYNAALEAANNMAETSTPQDYLDAFTRLFNAINGLVINMPQSNKFYVLRCNHENRYIYVNAENKLQWAASSYDKALSNAVWVFEDVDASAATCKMKSLHTQSYLSGLSGSQWVFGETGKVVTLAKSPSVDGAVIFKIEGNGDNGLHAHGANNTVISHTNDAGANHYFFEEVEDVTTIKHTVTMSAKFSSVMLGYNATVPAGVKAYNAIGIDGGYVTLEIIADGDGVDNVIPANTPVVLYRTNEETAKTFNYTETGADEPAETVLGGSLFVKYVECDADKNYYKLMLKDGEAKMYWMFKEFNANGVSQGQNDDGGHIKCSANKIYMALPKSGSNPVTMYGMRFIDDSATGIEEMKGENGEVKAIYDLQGRKLTEITEPGMYIVDGKKVYVK